MKKLIALLFMLFVSAPAFAGWTTPDLSKPKIYNVHITGTSAATATQFSVASWEMWSPIIKARGQIVRLGIDMGTSVTPEVSSFFTLATGESYIAPYGTFIKKNDKLYMWNPTIVSTAEIIFWTK